MLATLDVGTLAGLSVVWKGYVMVVVRVPFQMSYSIPASIMNCSKEIPDPNMDGTSGR